MSLDNRTFNSQAQTLTPTAREVHNLTVYESA